jgi:hypothetical protein
MRQPHLANHAFCSILEATAVIHGSRVLALGGLNLTRISWDGVKRYREERAVPTCTVGLHDRIFRAGWSILTSFLKALRVTFFGWRNGKRQTRKQSN